MKPKRGGLGRSPSEMKPERSGGARGPGLSLRLAVGVACSLALGCGTGAVYPRRAILTGGLVNYTKQPQSVTENPIEPAGKDGEACSHAFAIPLIYVWLGFSFMSSSGKKAAAGTERVAVVDRSNLGILGVYANTCSLVTPGGAPPTEPAEPAITTNHSVAPSSSAPAAATSGDPNAWPADVPIADRSSCSFVCVAKEGAAPRDSDKAALKKALDKHLGALRACVGGGKSAAGVVVSFDSRGNGLVNYTFGPHATPRSDCPGSFPPVKNVTGPASSKWHCTDYCE